MNIRDFKLLLVSLLVPIAGASLAWADPTVTQDTFGPDGQLFGGSISLKGSHVAVIAAKGSRYQVVVDGVEGPRIDGLLVNADGAPFNVSGTWSGVPIPVLFSQDGSHWAYMAKQSDEYIVMMDGKEMTRRPINNRNAYALNLTLSTNGQHVFWSESDAQGNYSIFVDGKAGPAMRTLPQLYLSPDGHYVYSYQNRGDKQSWAFVDGRQVNYIGEELQFTARNVLISTLPAPDGNGTILLLNGKPEIKAASFNQKWISDDGRQIAMVIQPQRGAQTVLTVNGKPVPGTDGVRIDRVYFSRDGKRYAALCNTKMGAKFMIVDGKKGDEYQNIVPENTSQVRAHWQYVTWTANGGNFKDLEPPVPGFTADSSKFVYVANPNGRQFLVVDGDESTPYSSLNPVLCPVGNRIAAYGATADNNQHLLMDGKDTSYPRNERISQFAFSPQGTRCAFYVGLAKFLVDNVVQPGSILGNYVFSQDDKHIAYLSSGDFSGVMCDGKLIKTNAGQVSHIFFGPEGNHIYWICSENIPNVLGIQTKDNNELFVDGKPALHYTDNAVQAPGEGFDSLHPEFSADGTMSLIARTDGNLRRFHVKSDTDLNALLAAAAVAKAK